jgi:ParB family chromosome partitioning protein
MEKRLGRGLDSLLTPKAAKPEGAPSELPIAQLRANPFQPRKEFEKEGLEELKDSIKRHGILQPVVVRRVVGGFELVSGERRLRAATALGMERIPAIVRDGVSDDEMLELALVENLQRRDLDPVEKAIGYRNLMDRLRLTQDQIAQRVGLQRSTVANHLRLLELPPSVQTALAKGQLQMGHARALLSLPSQAAMEAMATRAIEGGLSVREVEAQVRQQIKPEAPEEAPVLPQEAPGVRQASAGVLAPQPPSPGSGSHQALLRELERRLTESLGTRVELKERERYQGQILVSFHNRGDLERLLERLAPKRLI